MGPLQEARLARLAPEPPVAAQRAALDTLRGHTTRALILRPDDGGWDAVLDEQAPGGPDKVVPPDAGGAPATLPSELEARLARPQPLHLLRIERWFVRHHAGLAALRTLLRLLREREGPWSADVGPWAWAWMWHALDAARALPTAWAPAPLDGEALAAWLGSGERTRLRSDGQPPNAATFHDLATRSHGEAGTALAIWRACLRDGAERAESEGVTSAGTVWIRHPGSVELPTLAAVTREELLVVHALLLHGGATIPRLHRALGTAGGQVEAVLASLSSKSIVARGVAGGWAVAPLALPAVRARLESEAFPGWAA